MCVNSFLLTPGRLSSVEEVPDMYLDSTMRGLTVLLLTFYFRRFRFCAPGAGRVRRQLFYWCFLRGSTYFSWRFRSLLIRVHV